MKRRWGSRFFGFLRKFYQGIFGFCQIIIGSKRSSSTKNAGDFGDRSDKTGKA